MAAARVASRLPSLVLFQACLEESLRERIASSLTRQTGASCSVAPNGQVFACHFSQAKACAATAGSRRFAGWAGWKSKHRRLPRVQQSVSKINRTLWYRVSKPPVGTTQKTWVAHWNGLGLALENQMPIVGVLKDAYSYLCASSCIFDCVSSVIEPDGNAMWLQLVPRGEAGCEVRPRLALNWPQKLDTAPTFFGAVHVQPLVTSRQARGHALRPARRARMLPGFRLS